MAGLAACSPNTAKEPNSAPSGLVQSATRAGTTMTSPETTVREFLTWYTKNKASLPANFIDHADGRDTTQSYQVNFATTEKWLTAVNSSGVVSPVYIKHWRAYFKQWSDTLQLRPQHDGPPAGFDYDFLMLTQDPEGDIAELRHGTFSTQHLANGQALVTILGPQHEGWHVGMQFKLSPAPTGKWLIDEMSLPDNLVP